MKKLILCFSLLLAIVSQAAAANKYDNPDTIVVARDGSGEFRTVDEAIQVCRAFMDYQKVIYVKNGVYKEKLIVPSWLTNITICGEDRDKTIITWDDHANIKVPVGGLDSEASMKGKKMGTFRSYTMKVEGNNITIKNLTLENASGRKGQAVALHTEGDCIVVTNCRILGNQDTVYTGVGGTRVAFYDCYIDGTTDFIFGPSTAWFENCEIRSKLNSYVTAAATPANQPWGYVFHKCRLTAEPEATQVYLGRPWRPYASTIFIDCELGNHIRPEGWHNWGNKKNEETARYGEYANHGPGAATGKRVAWGKQLTKKEAAKITIENVLGKDFPFLKR